MEVELRYLRMATISGFNSPDVISSGKDDYAVSPTALQACIVNRSKGLSVGVIVGDFPLFRHMHEYTERTSHNCKRWGQTC